MTKQHFIALAAEFKKRLALAAEVPHSAETRAGVESAIAGFCDVAEQFNPRFDRARFMSACGM